MSGAGADRARWDGMDIIVLRAGGYLAWAAPQMGGNVLRLAREDPGVEALRTPPDAAALRAAPAVYGTPLLLPPNRIHGGAFTFEGRAYRFPVNEPARSNFIHGFLLATRMEVIEMGADAHAAHATLCYRATPDAPYTTFPHAFTLTLALRLDAAGLAQTVAVTNDSPRSMPLGIGFHTAFAVPAARGADYRVLVPVRREWLLDRTSIRPTGRYAVDTPLHRALRGGGLRPLEAPVSSLIERAPGPAILRDTARGTEIRYDVDPGYRFWMLWNEQARADHFCIEPMTWAVDAPNSPLPPAQSGFAALVPGETRRLASRISIDGTATHAFQTERTKG